MAKKKRDKFTAATWNVLYQTEPKRLAPILDRLLDKHDVSILLMQEMSHDGVMDMVRATGLKVHRYKPQYVIAWDPAMWTDVATSGVRLASTPFYRKGSKSPVYTEAATATLCDPKGRCLDAMSYHTPSAVQGPNPQSNRIQALREAAVSWRERAKESEAKACLFGGDDNVDERLSHGPWNFLQQRATGLRLVQAPGPTIGKTRRIDDFRTKGLKPKQGHVLPGGGDHRVHVRTFAWQ